MASFVKKLKIPANEIFDIFSNPRIHSFKLTQGHEIKRSQSLKFFQEKGTKCDVCGVTVDHFKIRKEKDGYYGLVAFAHNGIEMTRDHHVPKCLGGSNKMENLIPMCKKCNSGWKTTFDRIELQRSGIIILTKEDVIK